MKQWMLALYLAGTTYIAAADPAVVLQPKKAIVEKDELFAVDLFLNDFPLIQGGGVDLRFNPRVLQVSRIDFADDWNFATASGDIDNDRGRVHDLVFASFPGASGETPVATIWFSAIHRGKSRIRLTTSDKNPFAGYGVPVKVKYTKGTVRVTRTQRRHKHRHPRTTGARVDQ